MRDARYLREHDPHRPRAVLARMLRSLAFATALAASFVAGRWLERRSQAGQALAVLAAANDLRHDGGTVPEPPRPLPAASAPAPTPAAAADAHAPGKDPGSVGQATPATLAAADLRPDDGLTSVQRQAAGSGEYTLHLASLPNRVEAKALAHQLQRRGFPPNLYALAGSAHKTAVRLGRFASAAEAEQVRARLSRHDIESTVVRQGPQDVLLERGENRSHGRGH